MVTYWRPVGVQWTPKGHQMETKWKPMETNGNQMVNTTNSLFCSAIAILLLIQGKVMLEHLQVRKFLKRIPSCSAPLHTRGALLHECALFDFVPRRSVNTPIAHRIVLNIGLAIIAIIPRHIHKSNFLKRLIIYEILP